MTPRETQNPTTDPFADIRPYHDDEVASALRRLLRDDEFLDAMVGLRFAGWPRWTRGPLRQLVRANLALRLRGIRSVEALQGEIAQYLERVLSRTTRDLTNSGLASLDRSGAHLFVSNHRDIAMDPALVNWLLHLNGFGTVRIAIGDNLLSKPYVADLMRLNKSFIVQRSRKSGRELLLASKKLSAYIHHSLTADGHNVWIAQREGRAKDGQDRTQPAVVKMLAMNKPKAQPLGDYIAELNLVPVAISYEYDPCDLAKARELHAKASTGHYEKEAHEDVASIATGITGDKGRVHVAFGQPLRGDFVDADAVATAIDRAVLSAYRLWPSNLAAYRLINGQLPAEVAGLYPAAEIAAAESELERRLTGAPVEWRPYFLANYANPVVSRLTQGG